MPRYRIVRTKTGKIPLVLDLFAGAGGTGLGFRMAGFRIVGAVESDLGAAETYRRNLKARVTISDMRLQSPAALQTALELRPGELDVLIGCPPCQGFSQMRNQDGAADERNTLVLRYLDFVKEFRPRFGLFENVPGLLRSVHGRAFYDSLNAGLRSFGYGIVSREVDAADYGVPQHRRRVIVIAGRAGEVPQFPWPTYGSPNSAPVRLGLRKPWLTVRDAIEAYPPVEPAGAAGEHPSFANHYAGQLSPSVLSFIRQVPRDGGSRTDVPREHWLRCHIDHRGHSDVYGRLAWDRPANTITAGCANVSKGRFVHPLQDRALTLRESAALQGFPDDFTFYGRDIATQIGNAVPPPLANALACALRENLL